MPGGGAATVSFANRWLAEQAFLKASKLSPDVTLSFEWIANPTTGASPAPAGDDAMMEYDEVDME